MKIVFADQGWEDFTYWLDRDRKLARRIVRLIRDIQRSPFEGIGKPEPLKYDLSGYWSRRINDEHRLVYSIQDNAVLIAQARRSCPCLGVRAAEQWCVEVSASQGRSPWAGMLCLTGGVNMA